MPLKVRVAVRVQGMINVKVKDKESGVVDETLSCLPLAQGLSMCREQMVGSSLHNGQLDAMRSAW